MLLPATVEFYFAGEPAESLPLLSEEELEQAADVMATRNSPS